MIEGLAWIIGLRYVERYHIDGMQRVLQYQDSDLVWHDVETISQREAEKSGAV